MNLAAQTTPTAELGDCDEAENAAGKGADNLALVVIGATLWLTEFA